MTKVQKQALDDTEVEHLASVLVDEVSWRVYQFEPDFDKTMRDIETAFKDVLTKANLKKYK